jgi:peptide/nickel transport system permease protein
MVKLAAKRLMGIIVLLLAVAFFTFMLVRLAPGDYFTELSQNPQISEETLRSLREQYGLDRAWYAQFGSWLSHAVRGDFGYSIAFQMPAVALIKERFFNTVLLAVVALGIGLLGSIPIGLVSIYLKSKWFDRALDLVTSVLISVPSFLWALFALLLAARTGLFPIGGSQSIDYDTLSRGDRVRDIAWHLVLPALVLGVKQIPTYLRQLRGNIREILGEDYIVTARAKGVSEALILTKHALRNALNPMVTMFGQSLGALLSGAFVIEAVMSWPGLGNLAVNSLLARDLDVLVACLLYAAALLALGNLVSDVLLNVVDPRVRRRSAA